MLWSETASLLFCVYLKYHCKINGETIRKRQKICTGLLSKTDEFLDSRVIFAGSVVEGIAVLGQSDVDIMASRNIEVCYEEDCVESIDFKKYKPEDTYIADRNKRVSKGFTLLRKKTKRDIFEKNDYFINVFLQAIKSMFPQRNYAAMDVKVKGPAFQLENVLFFTPDVNLDFTYDNFSSCIGLNNGVDFAFAIPYKSNTILKKWLTRKRRYSFPTEEVKAEISRMSGHVVPVGRKGSELCEYEWRICYTEAEIRLVHSLNEVQLMLYYKLKVFVKTVLTSKGEEIKISSYIVKNILFWVAESLQDKYFKHEYFIPLFKISLSALKKCILENNLPNYMIPERNLLEGKLTQEDREVLVNRLSYWIETCPIFEFEPDIVDCCKILKEARLDTSIQRNNEQNPSIVEFVIENALPLLKIGFNVLSNIKKGNIDDNMIKKLEPVYEDALRFFRVAIYLYKMCAPTMLKRQRYVVDIELD